MRILVTGGAGFIGSHLVRALESHGHDVHVLDNLSAGMSENLAGTRAHLTTGDITDPESFDSFEVNFDAVVHCAAETHVDRSITNAAGFAHTNVCGTLEVLEFARRSGISRVLHVSTDEVYGSIDSGAWDEHSPLLPRSPYSASKAASDLLALSYVTTYGMDVTVTRCSNNYGPRQLPEKLIPHFVHTLSSGGSVPVYGDGLNVRDWLHVDDHCQGIYRALMGGAPGRVYNIGGGTELTNLEITHRILAALQLGTERIRYVPDRQGHDRRYALRWDRAQEELGYTPSVPFDVGLESTIQWYIDNPKWLAVARARAELLAGSVL